MKNLRAIWKKYLSLISLKKGKFNTILFLGMGNENELESESIRRGISKAVKKVIELKLSELNILLFNNINFSQKRIVELIVESSILSKYTFDRYKTDKKEFEISKINLLQEGLDESNRCWSSNTVIFS
ncbi:hypothetical protein C3495_02450 [Clostridiaceae bacterium 14S0207]|nr:hypothetical protein C3495_02450 [Clostridiaceae bacterium 14S0207]